MKTPNSEAHSEPDPAVSMLTRLDLVMGDIKVVTVGCGVSIFTREPLREHGTLLQRLQARFLEIVGERRLFFATENMTRHKPVTDRTLRMLEQWCDGDTPEREFIALELKDGDAFNSAPNCLFKVLASQPGSPSFDGGDSNLIALSFEPSQVLSKPEVVKNLAIEIASSISFVSGHAGLCFHVSRYFQSGGEAHAWRHSMRHRAIDIFRSPEDQRAVATDGLKTVSWLTFLGNDVSTELGGVEALKSRAGDAFTAVSIPNGVMLQASVLPKAGDSHRSKDLEGYRSVFRVVRPLVERSADRYPAMWVLGGLKRERTEDWLFRLDRSNAVA